MARNRTLPSIPLALVAKIDGGKTVQQYRKNQAIFLQGDVADAVFYIRQGKVKLTVVSRQGKEAVLAILASDSFFGEGCLAGQPRRMSTATALSDCSIVKIEKRVLMRVLREERGFSESFIVHLLTRNIRVEEDMVALLFNSSEKRLARALLILANFGRDGKCQDIIPKVSQTTLAEMIGTTRPRVTYFMNKFRTLGLIEYDHDRLQVHSSLLSVVLHD